MKTAPPNSRKNARRDKFKLKTPLHPTDWQFYRLKTDEEQFLAWQWESRRQRNGSGNPFLGLPEKLKKKMYLSFRRSRENIVPAHVVTLPFSNLATNKDYLNPKAGHLLLILDIDLRCSKTEISSWLEQQLERHPDYRAAAKNHPGRKNADTFKIRLLRLAVTRLTHAFGATKAREYVMRHWKKDLSSEEVNSYRRITEKDLERAN